MEKDSLIREIRPEDAESAARFLDERTLIHRWLVAFFLHLQTSPGLSLGQWSFRSLVDGGGGKGAEVLRAVAAHSFQTGITYVSLSPGFNAPELEGLLREDFLPEKIIGDGPAMQMWEECSPELFALAEDCQTIRILALAPGALREDLLPETGFRSASQEDVPVLREMEALFSSDLDEEDPESDFESLVAGNMVFVLEAAGRPVAMIRSNLSDGRYIHLGGLFVHPDFRGRRLGARLVAGLCRRIHESGLTALIDTAGWNVATQASCRSVGFSDVGTALSLRFPEDAWSRTG